jgi:Ala-tRNA(Pro) deacylase
MDPKIYLKNLNIEFKVHTHQAVFTCDDAKIHCNNINGIHSKNIFLKNKNKKKFYLVIIPAKEVLNFDKLNKIFDDKLGMASPGSLKDILNLTPGSVSPFGLINDRDKKTILIIHKDVWNSEIVTFHPNINTETLELTQDFFRKYIFSLNIEYKIIS